MQAWTTKRKTCSTWWGHGFVRCVAPGASHWPTSRRRSGVSESTLSRLESGQRRATLELLLPLARTYDVPLDDLVDAPRTGDPRIHLKPIRRFGMVFVPLSRRPGGTQAFKMIIPARTEQLEPTPQTHEGFEWLYVLNGRLRLVVGERDLTLPPGEVAEFDTSLPHWLGSADGGSVELLILFDPQGVRAHLRTGTASGT